MSQSVYSKILSTGSFTPGEPVTNEQLAARLAQFQVETSDEWIRTRTGIEQRYLSKDGGSTTELAAYAALKAVNAGQVDPLSIDLIIVATTTPDSVFPSTACQVQEKIGANNAGAFDIQAVCSGFAYAMSIADSMIRSGSAKKILIIGAETLSRILDWKDRGTCVLFGDGAGAVILEASPEPGILSFELKADGKRGVHVLATDAHINQGKVCGDPFLRMDGRLVFKAAIEKMTESALNVLEKAHLKASDIGLYIPHQANLRIMNAVREKLGIDSKHMMISVDKHGNTSAASIPLALDKAISQGRLHRGDLVLLQGVGGGFTWASVLLRY